MRGRKYTPMYIIRTRRWTLFRERGGVVFHDPVWVFIERPYMYIHPTLRGLLHLVVREWRNDRHLVG